MAGSSIKNRISVNSSNFEDYGANFIDIGCRQCCTSDYILLSRIYVGTDLHSTRKAVEGLFCKAKSPCISVLLEQSMATHIVRPELLIKSPLRPLQFHFLRIIHLQCQSRLRVLHDTPQSLLGFLHSFTFFSNWSNCISTKYRHGDSNKFHLRHLLSRADSRTSRPRNESASWHCDEDILRDRILRQPASRTEDEGVCSPYPWICVQCAIVDVDQGISGHYVSLGPFCQYLLTVCRPRYVQYGSVQSQCFVLWKLSSWSK